MCFFEDVNEPRCLKYWRNLTIRLPSGGSNANILESHDAWDNHVPNPQSGAHVCYPEAMYVSGKLTLFSDFSWLCLSSWNRLYYGDVDDADAMDNICCDSNGCNPPSECVCQQGNWPDPPACPHGPPQVGAYPLIKTKYGDFDGDCDIDATDYYDYLRSYVTAPGVASAYPLGDYDGDCDIDLVDLMAYRRRVGWTGTCTQRGLLNCPPWLSVSGTGTGAASAGGSPPATIEEDTAFWTQAFVAYLTQESLPAPPDTAGMTAEEVPTALAVHAAAVLAAETAFAALIQETATWLTSILSSNEKAALSAQLSDPTLTFATPTAANQVVAVIAALHPPP
jgi:hypothetical protein